MTLSSDAIVGILSVLLGFIFGEISNRLRDAQTTRQQIRSTRAMLRYEITHNLERLQQRWQALKLPSEPVTEKSQAAYYAEQLAQETATPFSHDVFTSQLPQFSIALTSKEVAAILSLYDDYEELDTIYHNLVRLQAEQRSYVSGAPMPTAQGAPRLPMATPFRDQAPALWQAYQAAATRCIKQGVPIR